MNTNEYPTIPDGVTLHVARLADDANGDHRYSVGCVGCYAGTHTHRANARITHEALATLAEIDAYEEVLARTLRSAAYKLWRVGCEHAAVLFTAFAGYVQDPPTR